VLPSLLSIQQRTPGTRAKCRVYVAHPLLLLLHAPAVRRTCDLCWHREHECAAWQHCCSAWDVHADCVDGPCHPAAGDTRHRLDADVTPTLRLVECADVCVCDIKGARDLLRELRPGQVLGGCEGVCVRVGGADRGEGVRVRGGRGRSAALLRWQAVVLWKCTAWHLIAAINALQLLSCSLQQLKAPPMLDATAGSKTAAQQLPDSSCTMRG
jgi:hypothetical protein